MTERPIFGAPTGQAFEDWPATLIIGGGLEGMSIALHLAAVGHPVYLVDRAPWIGGAMHLLDRTFPTDSCGLCLMAPVQPAYCPTFECELHASIRVLTLAEVVEVADVPRTWRAKVWVKPRYVDPMRCTNCGVCLEVCPEHRPALYEGNLALGKAIYRPPLRALPPTPLIDMAYCTNCGRCVAACPSGAIDLTMLARMETLSVAAIVLSPGYEPFDAKLKGEYGYGLYSNVITSLQFERLVSASGSTGGRIVRPSDGRVPCRIAFIHCVGSRDRANGREYCSSVCCMYTAKQLHAAKRAIPGLEATVFHMDLRAGGKGYDRYFEKVAALPGVTYRRSMVSSILERQKTKNLLLASVAPSGEIVEQEFELVVLSVGLSPAQNLRPLAEQLGLEFGPGGFCRATPAVMRRGLFVGGAFREPMDIPEVMVDSAAIAAQVSAFLHTLRPRAISPAPMVEMPARDRRNELPRVGVLLVHSPQDNEAIDLPALISYTESLPHVTFVRAVDSLQVSPDHLRDVSPDKANRWVIAAAGPVERARIRQQLTPLKVDLSRAEWINLQVGSGETATLAARARVAAAVARVADERVLNEVSFRAEPYTRRAAIIGGGPAGMAAALALAAQGIPVTLIEREPELGGQARELHMLLDGQEPKAILAELSQAVGNSPEVEILTEAEVMALEGRAGRFRLTVTRHGDRSHLEVGAVVVAIGAEAATSSPYGPGVDDRIITQRDLERRLATAPGILHNGVRTIVMVQCAGSRDRGRPYCSRICCGHAVKNALAIKRLSPGTEVYILYRDIRLMGLAEEYYTEARRRGVYFLRYEPSISPIVRATEQQLRIDVTEASLRMPICLEADWIVLSTGVQPRPSAAALAARLGVSLDEDGFFKEAHAKMRPLDATKPGIYICGLAHGPCTLTESIAQGHAAGMRAVAFLTQAPGRKETVVGINERLCSGCGLCVSECPYGARTLDQDSGKAQIEIELCLGCGACAVVCRSGATQQYGHEKAGILSAIEFALS